MSKLFALNVAVLLFCSSLVAAPPETIEDEKDVPEYTLPDPLTFRDGTPVKTSADWTKRRQEIHHDFATQVYGTAPAPVPIQAKELNRNDNAIDGTAIRREIEITITQSDKPVVMTMLIYTPKKASGPVPAFLALNFNGNHTISADPGIRLNPNWMRNSRERGNIDNLATAIARGKSSSRWPVEKILKHGFALCTIYYGDIDPDFDDGFKNGVHKDLNKQGEPISPEAWGSIATWAWGLSRGLDYLETDDAIDAKRVSVFGHSRLGKTSLWAGANDERFALVISNNSGCGGAALSRRRFGESVKRINTSFPHWFCDNFLKYNHNESECPVDQHELIALMAPRPVYVASAHGDQWADPHGEYLSCRYADPVYRLLDTPGLGGDAAPESCRELNEPISSGHIGYHIRSGKHDVTDYDWDQYLKFASRHLK